MKMSMDLLSFHLIADVYLVMADCFFLEASFNKDLNNVTSAADQLFCNYAALCAFSGI